MTLTFKPFTRALIATAIALWLAGCASPRHKAPVEDRGSPVRTTAPAPGSSVAEPAKPPLPGAENAGKPGYYTVKPGDTLIRIGLENGQVWKDIARWNNLEAPYTIEIGQVLVVNPAAVDTATGVSARPVATAKVEARPLDAARNGASAPASGAQPAASAVAPAASTPPVASRDFGDDDVTWAWPASGPVTANYDEVRQKGLAIAGKAGDPVLAAADGRVVYAGSGLRGYGQLVIIKHNNTFLTAYAHNQALLVKEDQAVRKGQKIAEMGSSDTDRVQLHFEIRKLGKPVDPAKLLPPR